MKKNKLKTKRQLKKEILKKENIRKWICKICGKRFSSPEALGGHMSGHIKEIKKTKEKKVKYIDIKEFRELGYLQELNRQFLHPLGLALDVEVDEKNGEEKLHGIWDYRKDEEGIFFDLSSSNEKRLKRFKENAEYVNKMRQTKKEYREKLFGNIIEPIPNTEKKS